MSSLCHVTYILVLVKMCCNRFKRLISVKAYKRVLLLSLSLLSLTVLRRPLGKENARGKKPLMRADAQLVNDES